MYYVRIMHYKYMYLFIYLFTQICVHVLVLDEWALQADVYSGILNYLRIGIPHFSANTHLNVSSIAGLIATASYTDLSLLK
jgi:hypothetical protein